MHLNMVAVLIGAGWRGWVLWVGCVGPAAAALAITLAKSESLLRLQERCQSQIPPIDADPYPYHYELCTQPAIERGERSDRR